MKNNFLFFALFFIAHSIYAQDWCRIKPAQLDEPKGAFNNKLISDRFFHTVNPEITKCRNTQIEVATIFRPEIFENNEWTSSDTLKPYSIYSSLTIKHAFYRNLEIHLFITDIIVNSDQQIRDYSNNNVNTSFSLGAKYNFNKHELKYYDFALYGQLTIPKPANIIKTFLSPEIRLLVSHTYGEHIKLTGNLGTAYSNYLEKIILLYNVDLRFYIGLRMELFTEFYRNYTKTGPPRNPHKRGVFGFGFYFFENLYFYSSFEAGWENEDSLNDGRIDLGITYRFI